MADSAVTHWTHDDLTRTHRSVDIVPEDVRSAVLSFTTEQHRLPTHAERNGRAFRNRELEIAQNRYNDFIEAAVGNRPTVDAVTLKSLLVQESGLNPAPPREGQRYQGIAQLGPGEAVADGHAIDRHDPAQAIDVAARVLGDKDRALDRLAYRTYGSPDGAQRTKFALAAYNGGEGTVAEAMRLAYRDGIAAAEQRGDLGRDADRFARDRTLHFDSLLEPKDDPARSPLYRAAELTLRRSDPLEKYREIGNYANEITERAAINRPLHVSQERTEAPVSAQQSPGEADATVLVNHRVLDAAKALEGMSTRTAQTHDAALGNGNVACAYAVNQIFEVALGRTYGENREAVQSMMTDLLRHGHEVPAAEVRGGDVAVKLPSHGERHGHIGIVMDDGKILSNSSSRGSLTSSQTAQGFAQNYRHRDVEDQVVYLRIDPASVDLAYLRSHPIPPRSELLGASDAPPNVQHWFENRPVAGPMDRGKAASKAASDVPPLTDARRPRDAKIYGETRNGEIAETSDELVEKNVILQEAIRDAKDGKILDFRYVGNGRESAREVERQNEKLHHAIAQNLPDDAKPEYVGRDSAAEWTPGMTPAALEKLVSTIRGGSSTPTVSKPKDRSRADAQERGLETDR